MMEMAGAALENEGGLDLRALLRLQAQAFKAAQAQIDAQRQQLDVLLRGDSGRPSGVSEVRIRSTSSTLELPSHDTARQEAVAYLARIEAETKREEEQDEPSTTYDRVRNAAIALCVLDCSLGASGILTDGIEGKMFQARCLIAPIATTGLHLLFFGTLDSSAMASVAVWTWRVYFFVLGALTFICPISVNYYRAAFYLIFYWFGAVYYWCWLLATARERMLTRFEGGLAARSQLYTSRLFQIASFQMALLVQGLTQGVGPKSFGRNLAILTFSVSMLVAWAFSTQVFDAGETDTRKRATRLRLSPRESAALAASVLDALTGLAGYVMAEQGDPDGTAGGLLLVVNFICVILAAVFIGRLVKDAKEKDAARARDSTTIRPGVNPLHAV